MFLSTGVLRSGRWVMILAVLSAGCSTGGTAATSTMGSLDASDTTSAPETTTTVLGSAPVELSGRWAGTLSGEPIGLIIDGAHYKVDCGDCHQGDIVVEGDTITFIQKNDVFGCAGEGTGVYRWSVEDGVLRFEPAGEELCPGRKGALVRVEYTLVDPSD